MLEKHGLSKIGFDGTPPTVVVGMSGGVDSSVAALILKWQGYNVIGLFMKNWEETSADGFCTSEADFADVKRVSEIIGIPYYTVNFSKQYMENVFKVFLEGLQKGVTPNPDVLCNREIKFGPFLKKAFEIGADYVATGHYCRTSGRSPAATRRDARCAKNANALSEADSASLRACLTCSAWSGEALPSQENLLLKGVDEGKDQSYFLCGLSKIQLAKVMFPVGDLKKEQVREIAREAGLATAEKKDSTGICFIGERNFREFLKDYLGNKAGDIVTMDGTVVGRHVGLMYYTLGQRKGLGIGGTSENTDRWFVVKKDLKDNILYVNNGECPEMFTKEVVAENFNWIGGKPVTGKLTAKTRYRQPDQKCEVEILQNGHVRAVFEKAQRAVTPGQWLVLYNGDLCLGGGQII